MIGMDDVFKVYDDTLPHKLRQRCSTLRGRERDTGKKMVHNKVMVLVVVPCLLLKLCLQPN